MTTRETLSPAALAGRAIAYRPGWYAVWGLCWILYHLWALLPGLLAKAFFGHLEGAPAVGLNLSTLVALIVALGLAKAGITFAGQVTGVPFTFPVRIWLQRNLLAHLLARPSGAPRTVGETISTLRDDTEGAAVELAGFAFDAVAALLFAVIGLAVLLMVDARVTLLVFLPIIAVIAVAQAARVRLVRAREESRAATASVTGAMGEIFGGVQAIQVGGAEERVLAYLERLGTERQRAVLRDRLQALSLDSLFESTASLGAGLVLLVAARAMRAGSFTVGDFALFASYLTQVVSFTSFLGYLINTYRQAGVSVGRLVGLLEGAPAEALVAREPGAMPQPALVRDRFERLEVAGLTYRHGASGRGVEGGSFTVRRGSFTVITGRIGSGKSTLLRALLGLVEPQAGELFWNGERVAEAGRFLLPPRVGYTPQVPTLLSGQLRESILMGWPSQPEGLERAIYQAVLERDLQALPDGLATEVGARGLKLSGGQVQRAAAARMFVREPELLVMDDLSSALDVETERALWERLFAREATCLVVSHRPIALTRADQILLMEEGRITAQGSLTELLQTSETMRQLWSGAVTDNKLC